MCQIFFEFANFFFSTENDRVKKKKVLLLGAQGLLGSEVFAALENDFSVVPFARFNLDLTDLPSIAPAIASIAPDFLVNCAGFCNTERCEDPAWQEAAMQVNALAPQELARICHERQIKFLHFSTDFVFDGERGKQFAESAAKNPLNFYGRSKARGEDLLQKANSKAAIFRTAWLFGDGAPSFVGNILHLAKRQKEIAVASDLHVNATWARDLAFAVKDFLQDFRPGVFHATNAGSFSLFEIAQRVVTLKNLPAKVQSALMADFPTSVTRPPHAILHNSKLPALPPLENALQNWLLMSK